MITRTTVLDVADGALRVTSSELEAEMLLKMGTNKIRLQDVAGVDLVRFGVSTSGEL